MRQTQRGDKVATLIQHHRFELARLAVTVKLRRVVEPAVAPFVDGLWSADEVFGRQAPTMTWRGSTGR